MVKRGEKGEEWRGREREKGIQKGTVRITVCTTHFAKFVLISAENLSYNFFFSASTKAIRRVKEKNVLKEGWRVIKHDKGHRTGT